MLKTLDEVQNETFSKEPTNLIDTPTIVEPEIKNFNVDVEVINQTLDETNREIDNTSSEEDDEKKNYTSP
jgi:hypothetical protein